MARPVGRAERLRKWVKRRPAMTAFLVTAALGLLLGAVLGVVGYGQMDSEEQRLRAVEAADEAGVERLKAEGERDRAAGLQVIAEGERQKAQAERDSADKLRGLAETTAKDLQHEIERNDVLVYASQLARAQSACRDGYVQTARDILDGCRSKLRGWEYHHLRHCFDQRQVTLVSDQRKITSVSFHPDGKRLATAAAAGSVIVWDTARAQRLVRHK